MTSVASGIPENRHALRSLHHVGITVGDLDRAVRFWEELLGRPAHYRGVSDRPYLGECVGYPGVAIDIALIELPGGGRLELLEYQLPGRTPHDAETKHPGNTHLCFTVDDADRAWAHAVSCGVTPRRPGGPIEVEAGPNRGARVAYLLACDGVSFEIYQPA